MMNLLVNAPSFGGTITAPPSKSHTIRALICASLARKPSYIATPLMSADTMSALRVLRQLGVTITKVSAHPPVLEVSPPAQGLLSFAGDTSQAQGTHGNTAAQGNKTHAGITDCRETHPAYGRTEKTDAETTLDLDNSGSLLYFLGILLAAASAPICLTGDESLRSRPVEPLLAVYRQAGVSYSAAHTDSAVPPLRFCGPLRAGDFQLTGPFSQPVTGLLLTAPLLDGTSRITFKRAGERPYLRMTCDWLRTAGIAYVNRGERYFEVVGGQCYRAFSKTVPGDWSSALFPITAAVICNAALTVTNLDPADTQGDSQALSVLRAMGADIRCDAERRTVSVFPISGKLRGGRFGCTDIPDAVPVLAAAAVFCSGQTLLTHAGVCRFKECDRLTASAEELAKFGAHIVQGEDFLRIDGSGGIGLHPARVRSRGDHRIAMALAVAACGVAANDNLQKETRGAPINFYEPSCIEDFDCVKISYPRFIEDMNAAGAVLKECCTRR